MNAFPRASAFPRAPQGYGPPPPPPKIADLPFISTDRYTYEGPQQPGLTISFRDGSRTKYRDIKDEDWDHEGGVVTIVQDKVEHVFPLDVVAYMCWQAP